ncbi:MAG: hypothetical protein PGN13_03600 [Patulibacter minatonensis]
MSTRSAYAHDATVRLAGTGGDPSAIGAAITVALCGQWGHDGPCPLAPHHSSWHADPNAAAIIHVRTLYAVEPARHDEAAARIREALASTTIIGPDGHATSWRLVDERAAEPRPDEADHAAQLIDAP